MSGIRWSVAAWQGTVGGLVWRQSFIVQVEASVKFRKHVFCFYIQQDSQLMAGSTSARQSMSHLCCRGQLRVRCKTQVAVYVWIPQSSRQGAAYLLAVTSWQRLRPLACIACVLTKLMSCSPLLSCSQGCAPEYSTRLKLF